jgi:DNA-binding NarL/FixJ family response regulator/putative methionine-R-sulfoxide reductase with GAF domain
METEESKSTSKLNPQYASYERQKCFIGYSEQAAWAIDFLDACKSVLEQPGVDLEPDYAHKHLKPGITLREKALELIANTRMGIYDVSYWPGQSDTWHQPRNVFIELGMAIALNRPVLLVRHSSNKAIKLPSFLEGATGSILEFSGLSTLKHRLETNLPKWIDEPPEKAWWARFCYFGNRLCNYREVYPRALQWGSKRLLCHISDGADIDQADFRSLVEEVLERFDEVEYAYLDQLSIAEGYTFLLCSYCQTARTTPFAIYRITPNTPPETFVTIGMSIAIERQFGSKILKILLTENTEEVPALLSGYDVVVARNDKERKERLLEFLPEVLAEVRRSALNPVLLPFLEHIPLADDRSPITDGVVGSRTHYRILIVDDDERFRNNFREMFSYWFQRRGLECEIVEASSPDDALKLAEDGTIALALIDVRLRSEDDVADTSGIELAGQLREKMPNTAIILSGGFIRSEDVRRAFLESKVDDVILKGAELTKLEQAIARALGLSWEVDVQEVMRAHSRRLKTLSSSGKDILDLVLRELLRVAKELTGATHGQILLYEPADHSLVVAVSEPGETSGLRIPLSEIDGPIGLVGRAALTKSIVGRADVVTDPDYLALNQQTQSQLSIPLLAADSALVGVLSLESDQIGAFSDEAERLLMSLIASIPEVLTLAAEDKSHKTGFEPITNPFVLTTPVRDQGLFIDRAEEMEQVLRQLEGNGSVSIIGPRAIGKTSFLFALAKKLEVRSDFLCIYTDMQGLQSEQHFFRSVLRALWEHGVRPNLMEIERIDPIEELGNTLSAAIRQGKRVILLLDEFEAVTRWGEGHEFGYPLSDSLRAWANTGYISLVVASTKPLSEFERSTLTSPLFNSLYIIELAEFTQEATRTLATLHGTVPFNEDEVAFISDLSRGNPLFIQLLASMLIESKNAHKGKADLEAIVARFSDEEKRYTLPK